MLGFLGTFGFSLPSLLPLVLSEGISFCLFLAVDGCQILSVIVNLARVEDVDWDAGPVRHVRRHLRDLANGVHTFDHLAEDDMLAVQVGTLLQSDKELGRVRVWAAISHRQNTSVGMSPFKVLILEGLSSGEDAITPSSITFCDIASLDDEAIDDTMHFTTQVVQLVLLLTVRRGDSGS